MHDDAGAAYAAPDSAETAGPGRRAREHILHQRVDRAGTAKQRWLAAELVLQGRCADTGVPYAAPADGDKPWRDRERPAAPARRAAPTRRRSYRRGRRRRLGQARARVSGRRGAVLAAGGVRRPQRLYDIGCYVSVNIYGVQ